MASLYKAINGMSLSLYKHMAEDNKNVFFCPFSISTALSMLLCGARNHTEQEMREVLHFNHADIPSSEVHHLFDQLLSMFSKASDDMTLTSANAILSQKDVSVLPEFKETVEKTYRALFMEVDFTRENEKTVREVNNWVKQQTNGMIKQIVESFNPSTVMVLLNAIYFKGSWKHTFNPKFTHPRLFYNRGQSDQGKKVSVMIIGKIFKYIEKETYKALELPYKNDNIVMLLLLPKEMDGLKDLESQMTVDLLLETMNSLDAIAVGVALPKFRIEYSKTLSETLRKLGMVSAFESSANFKGINSENIHISEVFTKSVLDVNEECSEAAAATAAGRKTCGYIFNEKFEVDHPFMCIIYDKEKDMILFIGRVIEF